MQLVRKGEIADVMKAGADWEAESTRRAERSERRAWWVAGGAVAVAVLAVGAVAAMMPLKQTIPYLVYVNKNTGSTQVMSAVDEGTIGYEALNAKYWASRYVIYRESYYYTLLQYDYDTTLLLSSQQVGRDYAREYSGPDARDKRLGAGAIVDIKIVSVVLPPGESGKAVVRFQRTVEKSNEDRPEAPRTYVATMAFTFKPSMFGTEKKLIENPLGFQVTAYRRDAEIDAGGAGQ